MNFKKNTIAALVIGSVMAISTSAISAPVLQDAWQMNLPAGNTSNIGHLVVSGGQTTITQELDAGGNILVGSRFENFGGLFSITYTPENSPGGSDFGAPAVLPSTIEYNFSGLAGTVSAVDAGTGAVSFVFDAGVGSAQLTEVGGPVLATFTPQDPSGGSLGNFFGAVNTSGTSNLLFSLESASSADLFQEADGTNFVPGQAWFAIDTTNQIFTPATTPFACNNFDSGFCSTLIVTQQGKIDALTMAAPGIPEPSVMALLGLGLLGFGVTAVRRKS